MCIIGSHCFKCKDLIGCSYIADYHWNRSITDYYIADLAEEAYNG